ncbi:nuclear transport factor 2 family protein [Anaerobacillus sp. CMMVII]|uniref:nuclear transport factor 2 family protein n=1 Tax=Anaerobacillus sp. CMMVII TaxID=2755588 RepID=UPI0021B76BB0|nr:nuclear transport factor 2 family protein [Anaerobacillus sp. CMMVII]MCT8138213.1 nuclear transport factor 2 family protein [Anaerobacillus sp. CMMVII]
MIDFASPAQKQLEAYNNRDLEAFMACYAETCFVEDGAGNVLMENKEAMRKRYELLFEESPNLHCRLVSRIVLENYVLDEERVTGSRGSTEERHVVAVYKIENGLICHVRFLN